MGNSISHPENDFERILSHNNPTKLLCLRPKKIRTREISSLTGSSSIEELNRSGTFSRIKCNPYLGMTLLALSTKNKKIRLGGHFQAALFLQWLGVAV